MQIKENIPFKVIIMLKKALIFFLCLLCTTGTLAQYHMGSLSDRTKQGVRRIHKRNEEAGKRISKKMTDRRQAQNKGRCKENFKFKELTIVASYDNYQRKSNLIMTKLNSGGDWIDDLYFSSTAGDKDCGFCISARAGLRDSLIKIYDKYVEWKKVAEDNNVTSAEKTIPVSLPFGTVYHNDAVKTVSHGYQKDAKPIKFTFIAAENGAKVIEAKDIQNLFPDFFFSDWVYGYLRFGSPEELHDFIEKIDEEAFYNQLKVNSADLFK